MNIQDKDFKELLDSYPKFCVYGLSSNSAKPSHYVPVYMKENGWDIVGVYPKKYDKKVFNIFHSLKDVPIEYRKFVNVFRSSEKIPELVDEILELGGVEVIWLQLGISHPEAEAKAEAAGIKVVSNRCLIIEHEKYYK